MTLGKPHVMIDRLMKRFSILTAALVLGASVLSGCSHKQEQSPSTGSAQPSSSGDSSGAITIGYSDWPGWTCWDIADQQGFFKKHNVNVKLVWFPTYTDSLNALAAGQTRRQLSNVERHDGAARAGAGAQSRSGQR